MPRIWFVFTVSLKRKHSFKPNMYHDILSVNFRCLRSFAVISLLMTSFWKWSKNWWKEKTPPKRLVKNGRNLQTAAPRDTLLQLRQRQNMDKRQVVVYREVYFVTLFFRKNTIVHTTRPSPTHRYTHSHTPLDVHNSAYMQQSLCMKCDFRYSNRPIINVLTQRFTENKPSNLHWVCNLLHLYKTGQGDYKRV